MLTGDAGEEEVDHGAGDAVASMGGVGPDVDEVGVADTVGEEAGGADDRRVVVGDDGAVAVAEGEFELVGGAAVVEVVGGQGRLHCGPVDTVERLLVAD